MGWLSNIFNSLGSFGKNLFQGIGGTGAKLGQQSVQQSAPNIMSMFSGGQNQSNQPQQTAKKQSSNPLSSIMSTFGNMFGGGNVQQANPQTNTQQSNAYQMPSLSGSGSNIISSLMGQFMPSGGQSPQPQAPVPSGPTKTGGSPLGGILDSLFSKSGGGQMNLGQMGIGMALPLIGGAMAPKVKVPDLSQLPSYQKMSQLQTRNFSQMDPELESAINRDIQQANQDEDKQFMARWKSLRPGADLESDSVFAREWKNYKDQQAQNNVDIMAKQRFQNIQNNLQASNLEMNQLAQLAQADTYTVMMQLGLDAQAAEDFKSIFSDIGQNMISEGMGNNDAGLKMMQQFFPQGATQ